jgi:D-serine deaminase-like pyridoxal phosphate-dependent protein
VTDILYAVGMSAPKLKQAAALMAQGCLLKIIADSVPCAQAIVQYGQQNALEFEVWIEIDTDGHRSGVKPDSEELLAIGHLLDEEGGHSRGGARLGGVMTHAGASYELSTPQALQAMAEQERSRCVRAAERLRAAGLPCPVVSVGSTPTALSAQSLHGVTEVRAGVYVFFDLVMANVGVCTTEDVALSVLTTVIGHQIDKGWAIVDAGWMAMSRDRGTQKQAHDYGYGQVCDVQGRVMHGYVVSGANQEHGIVCCAVPGSAANGDHAGSLANQSIDQRLPIGMQLRILPNHACATAAQFPQYHAVTGQDLGPTWGRFYGW